MKYQFIKSIILFSIIIAEIISIDVFGCTVITKSSIDKALVGMNVDWIMPIYEIFYTPPKDQKFGNISFGILGIPNIAGGINDQGLFWYPATVYNIEINEMKKRSLYKGDYIFSDLLETCSTVNEAISFLSQYDLSNDLECVHLLIADKSGDWAIIEGDKIITKNQNFYVLENISAFKLPERHILCRHNIAYDLLNKADLTFESFRNILSTTCQGTKSYATTQFSAIIDLKKLTISLYHFQNFTEELKIDIKEELKKNARMETISELFQTKWSFLNERNKIRISEVFYQEYKDHSIDRTIERYSILKKDAQDKYEFDNWDLDFVGFSCMYNQRYHDALKIFQLNVSEYPDYAYGYYNLGRIYHKLGQEENAVKALQKSVDLDSTRSVTKKYLANILKNMQH